MCCAAPHHKTVDVPLCAPPTPMLRTFLSRRRHWSSVSAVRSRFVDPKARLLPFATSARSEVQTRKQCGNCGPQGHCPQGHCPRQLTAETTAQHTAKVVVLFRSRSCRLLAVVASAIARTGGLSSSMGSHASLMRCHMHPREVPVAHCSASPRQAAACRAGSSPVHGCG